MNSLVRRAGVGLATLVALLIGSSSGLAELPPNYTRWQEFAAIAAQSSIPQILGVVERIEFVEEGKYVVRAGACHVDVSISRETARGPEGQVIVGPSRIASVWVSEKRCR
jgi:hypothetical protein